MTHLQHALRALALFACALLLAAPGCGGGVGGGVMPPPPPVASEKLTEKGPPETLAEPIEPPEAVVFTRTSFRMMAARGGGLTRKRQKETVRATRQKLRLEDPAGLVVIVRADDEKIMQVDPKKRVYHLATFDERRRDLARTRSWLASQIPGMGKKARRAAEVLIGRRQPEVKVEWAEEPVTIAGRECWHVRLREDGDVRLELWVTPEVGALPVMDAVTQLRGELSKALLAERAKIHGFPMRLKLFGRLPDQPRLLDVTVESIEVKGALDGALFKAPAGYTRVRE